MVLASAFFVEMAPWPTSAGPFFVRGVVPYPSSRGRWTSIVNGSTARPLDRGADRGTFQSDDQIAFPVTGNSTVSGSAVFWLISASGVTCAQVLRRERALGAFRARPVRRHRMSSRFGAPRS